ncbi:MAG: hypothetical protein M1299_12505 [Firmicutes bacterium]|nr:hypothetical protein [Bacillota bacterium]
MTYPLFWVKGQAVFDPGDPLFNAYVLAWDYGLEWWKPDRLRRLFDANIMYPAGQSLAFSEHLLGNMPLIWPVRALGGNPILAYNTVLLISFVLSAFFAFLLARFWLKDPTGAFLVGLLFAFSPARMGQLSHLQILTVQWSPLALLFLELYLRRGRFRHLLGFLGAFLWQFLSSFYLGYFLSLLVAAYLLYSFWPRLRPGPPAAPIFPLKRLVALVMGLTALGVLAVFPIARPYLAVQEEWGLKRALWEPISGSADLITSYLSTPESNCLYGWLTAHLKSRFNPWEKYLFPGLITLFLAGHGLRGRKQPGSQERGSALFAFLALASFLLSCGPILTVFDRWTPIPLPYLLFHYLVPGFSSMRVPARLGVMTQLSLSLLAGYGLAGIGARNPDGTTAGRTRLLGTWPTRSLKALLVSLALLEQVSFPLPVYPVPDAQPLPYQRWLRSQGEAIPLIELPATGQLEDYGELLRQVNYTFSAAQHRQATANGYSGFWPASFFFLQNRAAAFPAAEAVTYLAAAGIRRFVLHLDELEPGRVARLRDELAHSPFLYHEADFGEVQVYRWRPRETSGGQAPLLGKEPDPGGFQTGTSAARSPGSMLHREQMSDSQGLVTLTRERPALGLLLPAQVSAGCEWNLGLFLRPAAGAGPVAWGQGFPLTRVGFRAIWTKTAGESLKQEFQVNLPPAVLFSEGQAPHFSLPGVKVPRDPGLYRLRVEATTWPGLADEGTVTVIARDLPTSAGEPEKLAASYQEIKVETRGGLLNLDRVFLSLDLVNTGEAIWLSRPPSPLGQVFLLYRWYEGESLVGSGEIPLLSDVYPGQVYRLRKTLLYGPDHPGRYDLEIDLVSRYFFSLAQAGTLPARVVVEITGQPKKGGVVRR